MKERGGMKIENIKDMKYYQEFPDYLGHSFREATEAAHQSLRDETQVKISF